MVASSGFAFAQPPTIRESAPLFNHGFRVAILFSDLVESVGKTSRSGDNTPPAYPSNCKL